MPWSWAWALWLAPSWLPLRIEGLAPRRTASRSISIPKRYRPYLLLPGRLERTLDQVKTRRSRKANPPIRIRHHLKHVQFQSLNFQMSQSLKTTIGNQPVGSLTEYPPNVERTPHQISWQECDPSQALLKSQFHTHHEHIVPLNPALIIRQSARQVSNHLV